MDEEKNKKIDICCPCCERKVATYDGKSSINLIVACKNCKKLVVYNVKTGERKLGKIPPRNNISGMRFY